MCSSPFLLLLIPPLIVLLFFFPLALFRFARDPRWSETGDRYIIKLFRDYVFHQVDENGNPVMNFSHVLTCLNKVRGSISHLDTVT